MNFLVWLVIAFSTGLIFSWKLSILLMLLSIIKSYFVFWVGLGFQGLKFVLFWGWFGVPTGVSTLLVNYAWVDMVWLVIVGVFQLFCVFIFNLWVWPGLFVVWVFWKVVYIVLATINEVIYFFYFILVNTVRPLYTLDISTLDWEGFKYRMKYSLPQILMHPFAFPMDWYYVSLRFYYEYFWEAFVDGSTVKSWYPYGVDPRVITAESFMNKGEGPLIKYNLPQPGIGVWRQLKQEYRISGGYFSAAFADFAAHVYLVSDGAVAHRPHSWIIDTFRPVFRYHIGTYFGFWGYLNLKWILGVQFVVASIALSLNCFVIFITGVFFSFAGLFSGILLFVGSLDIYNRFQLFFDLLQLVTLDVQLFIGGVVLSFELVWEVVCSFISDTQLISFWFKQLFNFVFGGVVFVCVLLVDLVANTFFGSILDYILFFFVALGNVVWDVLYSFVFVKLVSAFFIVGLFFSELFSVLVAYQPPLYIFTYFLLEDPFGVQKNVGQFYGDKTVGGFGLCWWLSDFVIFHSDLLPPLNLVLLDLKGGGFALVLHSFAEVYGQVVAMIGACLSLFSFCFVTPFFYVGREVVLDFCSLPLLIISGCNRFVLLYWPLWKDLFRAFVGHVTIEPFSELKAWGPFSPRRTLIDYYLGERLNFAGVSSKGYDVGEDIYPYDLSGYPRRFFVYMNPAGIGLWLEVVICFVLFYTGIVLYWFRIRTYRVYNYVARLPVFYLAFSFSCKLSFRGLAIFFAKFVGFCKRQAKLLLVGIESILRVVELRRFIKLLEIRNFRIAHIGVALRFLNLLHGCFIVHWEAGKIMSITLNKGNVRLLLVYLGYFVSRLLSVLVAGFGYIVLFMAIFGLVCISKVARYTIQLRIVGIVMYLHNISYNIKVNVNKLWDFSFRFKYDPELVYGIPLRFFLSLPIVGGWGEYLLRYDLTVRFWRLVPFARYWSLDTFADKWKSQGLDDVYNTPQGFLTETQTYPVFLHEVSSTGYPAQGWGVNAMWDLWLDYIEFEDFVEDSLFERGVAEQARPDILTEDRDWLDWQMWYQIDRMSRVVYRWRRAWSAPGHYWIDPGYEELYNWWSNKPYMKHYYAQGAYLGDLGAPRYYVNVGWNQFFMRVLPRWLLHREAALFGLYFSIGFAKMVVGVIGWLVIEILLFPWRVGEYFVLFVVEYFLFRGWRKVLITQRRYNRRGYAMIALSTHDSWFAIERSDKNKSLLDISHKGDLRKLRTWWESVHAIKQSTEHFLTPVERADYLAVLAKSDPNYIEPEELGLRPVLVPHGPLGIDERKMRLFAVSRWQHLFSAREWYDHTMFMFTDDDVNWEELENPFNYSADRDITSVPYHAFPVVKSHIRKYGLEQAIVMKKLKNLKMDLFLADSFTKDYTFWMLALHWLTAPLLVSVWFVVLFMRFVSASTLFMREILRMWVLLMLCFKRVVVCAYLLACPYVISFMQFISVLLFTGFTLIFRGIFVVADRLPVVLYDFYKKVKPYLCYVAVQAKVFVMKFIVNKK